jgi:hypothetical protein
VVTVEQQRRQLRSARQAADVCGRNRHGSPPFAVALVKRLRAPPR